MDSGHPIERGTAATGHEYEVLRPGSFVIERYVYTSETGAEGVQWGVQWVVHRVSPAGGLDQLIACDTRREAAQFIEAYRG